MTDPLTPGQVAETVAHLRSLYGDDLTSTTPAHIIGLCDIVEALATALRLTLDEWRPNFHRCDPLPEWWHPYCYDDDGGHLKKPMSPAEQVVVYGEVIASEESSDA